MGNGLFATADIPRGTRILKETAIIVLPVFSEEDLDLPALATAIVHGGEKDVRRAFLRYFSHHYRITG